MLRFRAVHRALALTTVIALSLLSRVPASRAQTRAPPATQQSRARPAVRATVGNTALPPPAGSTLPGEVDEARVHGNYERFCLPCHGATGRGDGPLARYLVVAPRDFTRQSFKWRSTPSGQRPVLDDVVRTIAFGVTGGGMPAFATGIEPTDLTALARHVLQMNPAGVSRTAAAAPLIPTPSPQHLAIGARVYERLQCATCHGPTLRGDGPSAVIPGSRPYDLTRFPPRGGADAASIERSLRTGIDGTNMPSFDGAIPPDELVSLALWLAAQIPPEVAALDPRRRAAIAIAPQPAGFEWRAPPSSGLLDATRMERERTWWDFPLAPQGPGPAHLSPAERSLHPDQCGRCHARQFEQFRGSIHAAAMGPGIMGQLVDMTPSEIVQCQTCHGPLAEQSPVRLPVTAPVSGSMITQPGTAPQRMTGQPSDTSTTPIAGATSNPGFDAELREQGIVCAACHVRDRVRFGPVSRAVPPGASHASLLPGAMYPLVRLSQFERGDFCAPCHQHTQADSIAGVPILDTVAEWTAGPYFARGIQCQSCHMSDRDHSWRGAHDPETVRQAVRVSGGITRVQGELQAAVTIENVGTGHAFPGTTTPAAVLTMQWLDGQGRGLGAAITDTIQRHLDYDSRGFTQRFDTRILPGAGRRVMARTRDANARALRYTLTFRPDDYYEGFYAREAERTTRSPRGRALLREALAHARASPFVIRTEVLAVPP